MIHVSALTGGLSEQFGERFAFLHSRRGLSEQFGERFAFLHSRRASPVVAGEQIEA